jgi:mevalonate kinase
VAEQLTTARVSTPGKLILMGEHAAVYGAPAIVTAVGLRLTTRIERRAGDQVTMDLVAVGHEETLDAAALRDYCAAQREAWAVYAQDPNPETFQRLEDGEPARLARVALGVCEDVLGGLGGVHLAVTSDLPLGAGFGSSAAAAVGIVAAAHAVAGETPVWSEVGPLAAEVERQQHGAPSGVDATTVFHGGVLATVRRDDELAFEPLAARADLLRDLRIVNTGAPAESTGEVVAAVAARRSGSVAAFDAILDTMATTASRFRGLITAEPTRVEDLIEPIQTYERCLEEIGVVPAAVAQAIRAIERRGGAAKLSGAGALTGDSAGCLLVLLPDEEELPEELGEVIASLGAEGVRVEQVA